MIMTHPRAGVTQLTGMCAAVIGNVTGKAQPIVRLSQNYKALLHQSRGWATAWLGSRVAGQPRGWNVLE
jgi:hypothetical protein